MKKKFTFLIRLLVRRKASVDTSFRTGGLVIALISVAFTLHAQSLFNRVVVNNYSINDVLVNADEKGLFLTPDGEIMKCDMDGNLIWQKKQGGIKPDREIALYAMVQLDTTILTTGSTDVKGKTTAVLLRYSRNGNLLNYTTYKMDGQHSPALIPSLISLTDDNHLIMSGPGGSGFAEATIMWLRTSLDGQNGRLHILEYGKGLVPVKLLAMNNGNGEVIVASYGPQSRHDGDGLRPQLFKVDSNGVSIWHKKFDLRYNASLEDMIHLKKGGYVLVGNGIFRSYILKTDEDFNVQWMKSAKFHFTDTSLIHPQFNAVLEKENQHLLIGGSILAETDSDGNLIEAHLDSNGNVFSKFTALPHGYTLITGRDQYNHLCFSTLDSANNYACKLSAADIIWYSDSLPQLVNDDVQFEDADFTTDNSIDLWQDTVSNLVYDGCIGIATATTDATADRSFIVYPNPTNGNVTIEATLEHEESLSIKVYDIVGKTIFAEDESKVVKSFNKQLDLSHLSAGTYFIQLIHDGKREVKKIIIEK